MRMDVPYSWKWGCTSAPANPASKLDRFRLSNGPRKGAVFLGPAGKRPTHAFQLVPVRRPGAEGTVMYRLPRLRKTKGCHRRDIGSGVDANRIPFQTTMGQHPANGCFRIRDQVGVGNIED